MQIEIRRASLEDAAAITTLSAQLGYVLKQEQIIKNINAVLSIKNHDAFVAVYDKKVIGWIGVAKAITIESPPYCEITGLIVDENFRGKGIGKLLIGKAKQWADEKALDTLRLRCNTKRTDAHLFYAHLGFKEIKQQKVFVLVPDEYKNSRLFEKE